MKHHLSALTLLMSSALLCNTAQATQSWFEVEVILFERLGAKSNEQFINTIKQFALDKSLTLQDDAVFGTLDDCPTLTQFERFSFIEQPKPISVDDALIAMPINNETVAQLTPEQSLATEVAVASVIEEEIIQCVAPDDRLLIQAFELQAQRLQDKVASEQTDQVLSSEESVDNIIDITTINTMPIEALNDDKTIDNTLGSLTEPMAIVFDPTVYIPYPVDFSFNGTTYQSVTKQVAVTKIPLTIKHSYDAVNHESDAQAESAATNTLEHTPDRPYLLDDAHLEMAQLVKKLRWQKSTKPLLHIGWRQPTLARHLAKPIHLFAGNDLSNDFDALGNDKHALALQKQETSGLEVLIHDKVDQLNTLPEPIVNTDISDIVNELRAEEKPQDSPIWQLDGLLKIYLNHFLFIESDFDLRKVEQVKDDKALESEKLELADNTFNSPISLVKVNSAIDEATETTWVRKLTSHPMKQHRKVRSKEIHYFDHPNLGMIIQIRRFKIPAIDKSATDPATS